MLSVSSVTAGMAKSYYEQDNYYTKDGTTRDSWQGKSCADYGLEEGKQINAEQFELMLSQSGNGCAGYDCTFTAPKSVSIMSELGSEEQRADMYAAHQRAVTETMKEIEAQDIGARITKNGVTRWQQTGNCCIAKFEHNLSRLEDPDMHTHCVVMNRTEYNGKSYTIDGRPLYERQKLYGTEYRGRLATELQKMGYEIEVTDPDKGFFEIKGFRPETLQHFSKRRAEIEEYMKENGGSTAREAQEATMQTRQSKKHSDISELRQQWQSELKELQQDLPQKGASSVVPAAEARQDAYNSAMHDLERGQFAWTEKTLRERVLARGVACGMTNRALTELMACDDNLLQAVSSNTSLGKDTYYTTRRNLAQNKEIMDRYRVGQGVIQHSVTAEQAQALLDKVQEGAEFCINGEQADAATRIFSSHSRYMCVQGYAGVGKTTMIERVRMMAEEWNKTAPPAERITLHAIAPSGKAASGLLEESGIEHGGTIHGYLNELDGRPINPNEGIRQEWDFSHVQPAGNRDIIIVDEAGLTDDNLMYQLQNAAEARNSQVIFLGDYSQLPPVGAGAPFKSFTEIDAERAAAGQASDTVFLTNIRRQKDAELLTAVRESVQGDHLRTFEILQEKGDYREIKSAAARERAIIKEMSEVPIEHYGDNALITTTNAARRRYNTLIRNEYVKRGDLKAGEMYTVKVRDGEKELEEKVPLSRGERVIFGANNKKMGVQNGMMGQIVGIEGQRFTVLTDSGKTVSFSLNGPKGYGYIQPAWAITNYKSQGMSIGGKTKGKVVCDMTTTGKPQARNDLYVDVSRAKYRAIVFTDNKTRLEMQTKKWAHKIRAKDFKKFSGRVQSPTPAVKGPTVGSVAMRGAGGIGRVAFQSARLATKAVKAAGELASVIPIIGKPLKAALSVPDAVLGTVGKGAKGIGSVAMKLENAAEQGVKGVWSVTKEVGSKAISTAEKAGQSREQEQEKEFEL
jgi:conjugative relaxase-like TrwC/TraI family protein